MKLLFSNLFIYVPADVLTVCVCVRVYWVMLKCMYLLLWFLSKRFEKDRNGVLSSSPQLLSIPHSPSTLFGFTFFSLPSHSPSYLHFSASPSSQLSFSISLHPSPLYLFLNLDSSFSSVSHQITNPRSDALWN